MSLHTPVQFELDGHFWTATETIGESPHHRSMAAGAHRKRTSYCRQHLLGAAYRNQLTDNPFNRFKLPLIERQFDLGAEFDILVVESLRTRDPLDYLSELEATGNELIRLQPEIEIPDYVFFDEFSVVAAGVSRFGTPLTRSEVDDLRRGQQLRTHAVLREFDNEYASFKPITPTYS